jgi:NAD(P)-dependent dehydrogenase (short-subunit alcohol dehydrogenase family)
MRLSTMLVSPRRSPHSIRTNAPGTNTNLKGVWLVAQAAAKRMIENKVRGSIVNIASILGMRVASAVAPYAVSKAGVIQMTKALALEWARYGIRVNALAPGYFATESNDAFSESESGKALIKRVPQRRLGQLRELDGTLLLLISNAGSFITGSVAVVDGGHLVSGL